MSARVDPGGEISWPVAAAERAINALADAGFVILRVDARHFDDDGRILEASWGAFAPDDEDGAATSVARAREEALKTLEHEDTDEFADWILISWDSPTKAQ